MRLKVSIVFFILIGCRNFSAAAIPAVSGIIYNKKEKTVVITTSDNKLSLMIDYSAGCYIKQLKIKNVETLAATGVYTGINAKSGDYQSVSSGTSVKMARNANGFTISNITYGDKSLVVNEAWEFVLNGKRINWTITRSYNASAELKDMSFPNWNFAGMKVWKGGILDNGGMVWCKYLKNNDDTYGVHTGGVTFWNAETGNGLRISPKYDRTNFLASKYSNKNNRFSCTQIVTGSILKQQHNLSRFVSKHSDVFAPITIQAGTITATYTLEYVDYFKEYSRGDLKGIDAFAVRELMNTTGRYGVVDNNIIGANGWLTNWKCLHEPFFAQIGMALNDSNYTRNMASTLNQERDQAMKPNGRVLSRWHNEAGDEIPGTYNSQTGYYEAMWGYTIDSQPDYVINTSEQFNLSGDLKWLQTHQTSCEKALDWLIKRDANNNGLFEMLNNNIGEKKASDWLDIVWASYENAFVNAQMYEALNLWAKCEKALNNDDKADYYTHIAIRLKSAFNKPVSEGGFWSAEKNQYVYWRDEDGSVHGDNLVTPVNFAAIAFGLCDDNKRISQILQQIEKRNVKENLFHWPLCYDSFKQQEVSPGNWPFPKYENGDIFPTWGYLGIRAYCKYDNAIALKYINKLLAQYKKDGLSSQRYSRTTQTGQGDDILAGICTSITALYRDIYGIRPQWNRMGLVPNMSKELNGTQFDYTLRGTRYMIKLNVNEYTLTTNRFSLQGSEPLGASFMGNSLMIYIHNKEETMLRVTSESKASIHIKLNKIVKNKLSWTVMSKNNYGFKISGLPAGKKVKLRDGDIVVMMKADGNGSLAFNRHCTGNRSFTLSLVN